MAERFAEPRKDVQAHGNCYREEQQDLADHGQQVAKREVPVCLAADRGEQQRDHEQAQEVVPERCRDHSLAHL